jgi:enoyl-CoA hydratase
MLEENRVTYQTLEIEQASAFDVLTLRRPEKLNALSPLVLMELEAAIRDSAARGIRALILTGAGKAFVAGADIAEMSGLGVEAARAFALAGHRVGNAIEQAAFPVIAAVNGFALGGGCELALACDFIIAAKSAKLGQPEVNLGLMPGFGGTQRLARRVGIARARQMIYTAEILPATEALAIGLVNEVVEDGDLMERARSLATTIAEKAPLGIAASKRALLRGEDVPLETANAIEVSEFAGLFATEDARDGMQAFVEKRRPSFKGR